MIEGTTSNIFAVKDRMLLTPPESEGILSGITRKHLLEAAAGLGIPARITTLTRGDLETADEVFISSTVREVLPVVRIEAHKVATRAPGDFRPRGRSIAGDPIAIILDTGASMSALDALRKTRMDLAKAAAAAGVQALAVGKPVAVEPPR